MLKHVENLLKDTHPILSHSHPLFLSVQISRLLEGGEVLAHVDVHVSIETCDGGKHLAPNAQLQGQSVPGGRDGRDDRDCHDGHGMSWLISESFFGSFWDRVATGCYRLLPSATMLFRSPFQVGSLGSCRIIFCSAIWPNIWWLKKLHIGHFDPRSNGILLGKHHSEFIFYHIPGPGISGISQVLPCHHHP